MNQPSSRRDEGFSLVELLVVIIVLGILATVTVFAVRGIRDSGDESACAIDQKLVTQAMEASEALDGRYASEATLKSKGLLREESQLYDVTLVDDGYTLVPTGACASITGPTTTLPTTVPLPPGVTAGTAAGFPTQHFGTGTGGMLLYIGVGTAGSAEAAQRWTAYLAGNPSASSIDITYVDLSSAGDGIVAGQLADLVPVVAPLLVVNQYSAGQLPPEVLLPQAAFTQFGLPICGHAADVDVDLASCS